MTNKILFIANWKMFGDLNSVKSIQSVINLSKKKNYKNELKREFHKHNRAQEKIAVVGMACRFPGGIHSPHAGRD